MKIPEELDQAAKAAKEKGATQFTPRQLLGWYGYSRRGSWIVSGIRRDLRKLGVRTEPDFESVWIDVPISLIVAKEDKADAGAKPKTATEPTVNSKNDAAEVAPSHRISRLKAANTKPVSVKPTDGLDMPVTLMMKYDFSQLPVMTSEREVKGIISWRSIGNRLALKRQCCTVKDCMEPHQEVRNTASMFDVIERLTKYDCVLVRDGSNIVAGIVTAADISEQFRLLSEPFLLLGDIENELRRLIERSFTTEDLKAAKDPEDQTRKVESANDLTFGEYVRLLENPANWTKIQLALDRVIFTNTLNDVRVVRNEVMHFDPDGVDTEQLVKLRQFSSFLERTVQLLE